MHDCPTCGQPTPEGNFCVRCGAPLDRQLTRSRKRPEFAASPGERRGVPWLISTLFPQLPRHTVRHFRIALAAGTALVIVLGVLRLFPIALICAALLMPLLTVLYFYDVDIYESEPLWAASWTLIWGAVTGVLVGLLAKAVAPTGPSLIDKGSAAHVITGGVLLPALGVLVMLPGPIVLLRYRLFNETLDGAGFGAATAAMFAAAEAVVVGVDVLSGGVRPPGAAAPWVARLVSLAVATPVLAMSAIGAACAAIWLRYRAPVTDRNALGVLGAPPASVLVAAALIIAGAIGETFMAPGLWLAWLVVLDLVALVLLRRAMHVGLLEESAEKDIGPPERCANCGAMTDTHTFCSNCGVALKALPKAGAPPRAGVWARRRLVVYGLALTAIVAIGFLVAALAAPPAPKPKCKRGIACGNPPIAPQAVFAFPGYTAWQSSGLGFSLRYNNRDWSIADQGADGVQLQAGDGFSALIVRGAPASQASPAALLSAQASSLSGKLLGFARDTNPDDELLGTNLGLTPGPGGVYTGTIDSPQGPQAPVDVAIVAAGNGRVSIVATVVAPGNDSGDRQAVYARADDIINSIQWSGV